MDVYKCEWYDVCTERICNFSSAREWNLKRHVQAQHEEKNSRVIQDTENRFLRTPEAAFYTSKTAVAFHSPRPVAYIHTIMVPLNLAKVPYACDPSVLCTSPEILKTITEEALQLKKLVVEYSRTKAEKEIAPYNMAQTQEEWEREIVVGVCIRPPTKHLHIHLLSRDMYSIFLLEKAQYNSFTTGAFIELSELPMTIHDLNSRSHYLQAQLRCVKCGESFGNQLDKLKTHLKMEFTTLSKKEGAGK